MVECKIQFTDGDKHCVYVPPDITSTTEYPTVTLYRPVSRYGVFIQYIDDNGNTYVDGEQVINIRDGEILTFVPTWYNINMKYTIFDVMEANNIVRGTVVPTQQDIIKYDIDKDGVITSSDVTYMSQYVADWASFDHAHTTVTLSYDDTKVTLSQSSKSIYVDENIIAGLNETVSVTQISGDKKYGIDSYYYDEDFENQIGPDDVIESTTPITIYVKLVEVIPFYVSYNKQFIRAELLRDYLIPGQNYLQQLNDSIIINKVLPSANFAGYYKDSNYTQKITASEVVSGSSSFITVFINTTIPSVNVSVFGTGFSYDVLPSAATGSNVMDYIKTKMNINLYDNYEIIGYYANQSYDNPITPDTVFTGNSFIYNIYIKTKYVSPLIYYLESYIYNKLTSFFVSPYYDTLHKLEEFKEHMFLDNLYGQYLDDYAAEFGLKRKFFETDTQLYNRIKLTISLATEQGSKSACIKAIAFFFGIPEGSVMVTERSPCDIVISLPSNIYSDVMNNKFDMNDVLQYFPLGVYVSYAEANSWDTGEWENDNDDVITRWRAKGEL